MNADEENGSLPLSLSGKIQMIVDLNNAIDEDGKPIGPLLTKEDILKIMDVK